jgi:SAM-dependent methyltransferase/biotin operon repressor
MVQVSDCLKLLADSSRLRILHLLTQEPLAVAELQDLLHLGQSSVSGHLAKLKQHGILHAIAEGSSHRYRLVDDMQEPWRSCWQSIRALTREEAEIQADRKRLRQRQQHGSRSWAERVAGTLHRCYTPGRTWDSLGHGFLHFTDFGTCIDVGAGDGAMLEPLAPRCRHLHCVDASQAMVDAGRGVAERRALDNVSWHLAEAGNLPFADASADSVLFLQSLQYIPDPAEALAEAVRVLRPGGRLLVVSLDAHGHREAERYGHLHDGFTADQLANWLPQGMAREQYVLPPEPRPPRFVTRILTAVR